jgi:hypothetical protein
MSSFLSRTLATSAIVLVHTIGCESSGPSPATIPDGGQDGNDQGADGGADASGQVTDVGANPSDQGAEGASDSSASLVDGGIGPDVLAGDAGDASDIATACAAYATAKCSLAASCTAVSFSMYYSAQQNCEERVSQVCQAELSAPGTCASPPAWMKCAQEIAQQTCGNYVTTRPADCMCHGSLVAGAGCEFSSQCASAFCNRSANSFCGTCGPLAALSEPCDPLQRQCENGLVCAPFAQWVCATPVPDGGACATGYQCDPSQTCISGVCTTTSAGVPCNNTECPETTNQECLAASDGGYVCTEVTYASPGQSCNPSKGVVCEAYQACSGEAATGTSGQCGLVVPDGQPCTAADHCWPPALCVDGVCQGAVAPSSCPSNPVISDY